jgi:hypothetical protein
MVVFLFVHLGELGGDLRHADEAEHFGAHVSTLL